MYFPVQIINGSVNEKVDSIVFWKEKSYVSYGLHESVVLRILEVSLNDRGLSRT